MEPTTTIYDVARVAGVSMATVSRVVNGNANVKEKTRQKVLDAIEELDYRPNAVARGLASKRTTTVGVVLPTVTSSYFAGILRGIDDIANMYEYNVIIANSDNDEDKELKVIEGLLSKQVDGIVFMGSSLTDKVRTKLNTSRTPIVLAGTQDSTKELASVNIDYRQAAFDTTTKLSKTNKKIAFVPGSLDDADNAERLEGYKEALKKANIKFDEKLVFEGTYDFDAGHELAEKLTKAKITSAIVAYDNVAVGILHGLLEAGVKVPDEFEIIAGSNSPITRYTFPAMTSVNQPLYDLGAISMRLLTKLMSKEEVDDMQLIQAHEIIERNTTKN